MSLWYRVSIVFQVSKKASTSKVFLFACSFRQRIEKEFLGDENGVF